MPLPLDESLPIGIHRYQVTVIASTAADIVCSAGGWMCDRARAGWDVNVLLAQRGDVRPLAILGATAGHLDGDLAAAVGAAARNGALAISAELLAANEGVRASVLGVAKKGRAEVTVWGPQWPAEFGGKVDPLEHRLSCAARAFKTQALGAAGPVAATETLFDLGAESFRPLYAV